MAADIESLWSEAEQISLKVQRRAQTIKARLDEIERQKAAIEAELYSTDSVLQRAVNFRPCIGRDFQCPRCWIRNEARSALHPFPAPTIATSCAAMDAGRIGFFPRDEASEVPPWHNARRSPTKPEVHRGGA